MATGNFYYKNRCILVTNDDYESGNVPETGNYIKDCLNSYPSRELKEYENEFIYFSIVLTCGYYSDSCIDYIEKSDSKDLEYYMFPEEYDSKKELFETIANYFDISVQKCYSLCRNKTIQESFYLIDDYLKNQEEKKINKILDGLKKEYGYKELSRYATFSNGETIYKELK